VVTATDPSGRAREWKPSFLVDASGRDTVLANRLGMKNPNRKHASISVFAHFRGVERLPGRHEGDISIFWFPHGWFWLIPLRDGTESVGVVCWPSYWKMYGSTDLREFLWNSIRRCPPLERRMGRAAEAGPATAAGNYSYRAKRAYGERYVLIGDAFTFTDPVFSSGVFVAMHSAYMAARAVDASLRSPGQSGRHLYKYEKEFLGGVNKLSWMIYRMTSPAMQYLFMNPRNYLGMKDTIISILSGNIFNRDASSSRYFLFKVLYYICSAAMFRQCLRAYHMRKRNINLGLDQ
jgi:flavin-dependent dehydrogenase